MRWTLLMMLGCAAPTPEPEPPCETTVTVVVEAPEREPCGLGIQVGMTAATALSIGGEPTEIHTKSWDPRERWDYCVGAARRCVFIEAATVVRVVDGCLP